MKLSHGMVGGVVAFLGAWIGAAETPETVAGGIVWYGQAAVRLTAASRTVYVDPYQLENQKDLPAADLILITHAHPDHLSPADITRVAQPSTVILAPEDCHAALAGVRHDRLIALKPGAKTQLLGVAIEAVPAYNLRKVKFHPRDHQWVGYIVDVDGVRVYHAGDTERVPEMKSVRADIALLPLGQTYTMDSVAEAAEAAKDIRAKIVIPIHYGLYEGKADDAVEFQRLLKDACQVVIKTPAGTPRP